MKTLLVSLLSIFMTLAAVSCNKKNVKSPGGKNDMTTDFSANPALDILESTDTMSTEGDIRSGEFVSQETIQSIYFDFDMYGLSAEARPECPPAWPRSVPGAAHAQMPAMRPRTPATHAAPPASTREPSTVRGGGLDGWAGAPITRGRVEAPRAPSIACAAIQLLHSGDGRRQSRPPARLGLQCLPVPRLTAGLAGRGEYKRREGVWPLSSSSWPSC